MKKERILVTGLTVLGLLSMASVASAADPVNVGQNIINWVDSNFRLTGLITLGGTVVLGWMMLRRMWTQFFQVLAGFILWLAIVDEGVRGTMVSTVGNIVKFILGG